MLSMDSVAVYAAVPALLWSSSMYLIQSIGILMVFLYYSYPPRKPTSSHLPEDQVPHITIIRPVKGLEPELYECLASTFRQDYPKSKLSIRICVSSEDDPAYPILDKIVQDFADFDVRILVEEYDPLISSLEGKTGDELGPNPKIRNISRAYREAKGELIWIIDCNVWISRGVAGRMVDRLMGFLPGGKKTTPFRFVHHMPLVVDMAVADCETTGSVGTTEPFLARTSRIGGGRLDEMFMATSHAKFYGAINTVGAAPCIIGKSNMFRKSHLDACTDPSLNKNLKASDANRRRGVDFFSHNICEDHLIGDLLWKADIPGYKKHGLVWGDIAIQPMSGMSVAAYCARRVRWLRARKWTVLIATLVEPGVESLLCNLYFAYAITTLPWFHKTFGIPHSWTAMVVLWMVGVTIWMVCDRAVYRRLHKCLTVEVDDVTPAFARGPQRPGGLQRKPLWAWVPAWIGREFLALPIWTWAVLLGTTVTWRGRTFRVHRDMSVYEHPEVQDVPKWQGRPTARHRPSHSKS
ncbi:family 21 glycosyltransferase [Cryphonectria parasitica EP155]|uniref:Ceramide glucosyltransferase n=1 Tax=Cryphonectria parasitica (strain ATCC 38755 / EP155) TaxID=660469 RepID=A0A9P4YFT6_CRYP1|nr:family 21 glycosyltransferase [Cryphonectria parasitica EP155]KAF3771390.1 family 21 glycosyltransferase [Cryphonectria parasitica EP155]